MTNVAQGDEQIVSHIFVLCIVFRLALKGLIANISLHNITSCASVHSIGFVLVRRGIKTNAKLFKMPKTAKGKKKKYIYIYLCTFINNKNNFSSFQPLKNTLHSKKTSVL